jgi:hypothetical protein
MTASAPGGVPQSVAQSVGPLAARFVADAVGFPRLRYNGPPAKPFFNAALAKKSDTMIALSDRNNNVVDIVNPAGTLIGELTGFNGPQGMASDIKGDLYIADSVNSRIVIYEAGFQNPPRYISDPGQDVIAVDSFSNGAYVAVANIVGSGNAPGSISIYKGSTLVSNVSDDIENAFTCAFDAAGNLFATVTTKNGLTAVGEIANATSGGTTFTTLSTTNKLRFASAVQVTTSGHIAVADQSPNNLLSPTTIYTYNAPLGGSLGTPVQVTKLVGSHEFTGFAFAKNMTDLYDAESSIGTANEFAYPAGGKALSTITPPSGSDGRGLPWGIAIIPTQYPSSK